MKKSIFFMLFLLFLFPMQIEAEENCEHEYADTIVNPTCTESGYTLHTCTNCGDSYTDTYTDAIGHNYVDYGTYEECENCHDVIEKEDLTDGDNTEVEQPDSGEVDDSQNDNPDSETEEPPVVNGWSCTDGQWKYGEDDTYVDGWKKINGTWYYFDNSIMVTDYKEIEEVPFYFNTNGSLFNGWMDLMQRPK